MSNKKTNINIAKFRSELETVARDIGAKTFGIADLVELKKKIPNLLNNVPGDYSRAVVFGMKLQKAALESIIDKPTPIYFHNYRQANYQLDRAALLVADRIQDAGFKALAVPASQYISKEPLSGHISHKLLGQTGGIGYIGRNNLLVHPQHGSQMRYVSVLTNMPLEDDKPYTGDCGSCRACIEVCPANAIGERPDDFDLNACISKLNEFTGISFVGQHICGVCVKACIGRG
ncbi:hypothetical protein ACFLS1_07615 [Verrucomicrobiota bacterium]